MPELVINVSNIISPLCYTVLKIEPYTVCPFRCIYCYSRWYMRNPTEYPLPRPKALSMFRVFAEKVYRRGLRPIPFRLSTLVDPFPPVEQLYRLTERILRTSLDLGYPLIINTKSVYYTYTEIRSILEKLLDQRLAVLQISLSALDQELSSLLEPRAPQPMERLRAVKELGSTGIQLVLRLSPFMPRVSPTSVEEVESLIAMARDLGVKHIIVESLRIESDRLEQLTRVLSLAGTPFEGYSTREVEGLKPVSRVSRSAVEKVYRFIADRASRYGITFSTCKDGLFDLHTAPDCCGAYLLRDFALRTTLYDIYSYAVKMGGRVSVPLDLELYAKICKEFSRVCLDDLNLYPRAVSKPLKYHEKKLLKVIEKKDVLAHVAPHILDRLLYVDQKGSMR